MTDLTSLTLAEARDGLVSKSFTSLELTDAHLKAVEAARALNAFVLETPQRARAMARQSDGRIAKGEGVIHISDVRDDVAYQRGDPTRRALVDIGGCRTLLSVGLRNDNVVLGVITIAVVVTLGLLSTAIKNTLNNVIASL